MLVGVETGHIFGFGQKDIKKPKFIIDAHLGKVMRAVYSRFNEQIIGKIDFIFLILVLKFQFI